MENNQVARQGLHVEYFSTAWMAFEFVIGLGAGLAAHSILLIAFGLDSFLEIIAGSVLIWRLRKEAGHADEATIECAEKRSALVVGSILLLLAVYIVATSLYNLFTHQVPDTSGSGIAIALASLVLMPFLAYRKNKLGKLLHSPALAEDGMCNITCAYIAGTVLIGGLLTALFGWWWADSVGALVLVYFIASEGLESIHEGLE